MLAFDRVPVYRYGQGFGWGWCWQGASRLPVGPPPLTLCLGFSHLSWRQWWILAGSRQEPAAPLVGGRRRKTCLATRRATAVTPGQSHLDCIASVNPSQAGIQHPNPPIPLRKHPCYDNVTLNFVGIMDIKYLIRLTCRKIDPLTVFCYLDFTLRLIGAEGGKRNGI